MFKVVQNLKKKQVSITNYNTPEDKITLYRDAEILPFYPEQIVEIHIGRKYDTKTEKWTSEFVGILPLGQTWVVFE